MGYAARANVASFEGKTTERQRLTAMVVRSCQQFTTPEQVDAFVQTLPEEYQVQAGAFLESLLPGMQERQRVRLTDGD